jgi:saccharopepsin
LLKQSVAYGVGHFSGEEVIDTVSLGNRLTIQKQSIGAASNSTAFEGVDGILGLAPIDRTIGTLPNANQTIPTVTNSLFADKTIQTEVLGVFLQPGEGPVYHIFVNAPARY